MEGPDEIIHQTMRLKIMATLNGLPPGEPMEFTRLKEILNATDGNMGSHLTTLEKAGYIEVLKDFVGKRPRTRVVMTKPGKRAFEAHVAYLKSVLDA